MPLFMRSNVAVILRTSAVVRPPPLIQACRPTGPCNSGVKKKNPRASACLRCREGSLWIFGATKSPLLCSMGGQSLSLWLLSFRTLNFTSGKYFLHAENGPFLLCYSENTYGGGARPLSRLCASDVVNSAPTSDRSIVVNGLITLFTHTHAQDSP